MRPVIFDLQDRAQLERYALSSLASDVEQAYLLRHQLMPFGVVVAKHVNGRPCTIPHPIIVGHPRMSPVRKELERAIKGTVRETQAHGVFYVRPLQLAIDGRKKHLLVLQLEHREFGDLVWYAEVLRNSLGIWEGPKELAGSGLQLDKTQFLPERWMQ